MIPTACVSYTCPDRAECPWRQVSFKALKAAHDAGRSRFCDRPGEVCPKALRRALHSTAGAPLRWAERRASGLSNADLADAIGREFGEWHQGCDGPGYTAMRRPPRIWFGRQVSEDGKRRKPDLQGVALVDAVRELVGVPRPVLAQEAAPWAGLPMFNGRR